MNNLPEKMKAVKAHNPKDYRLDTVDRPVAGNEEIIIKVKACGICAGDLKAYKGGDMFWEGSAMNSPVTPGHEFFGEIVELGKGAGKKFDVKIGDWVTAEQIIPCGECKYCKEGNYWMCIESNIYGFQKDIAEGGMSEYMRIPSNSKVFKIPKTLTVEEGAIIEPLSCAIHAVQRADIQFDDTVVLSGVGPLGLCMLQLIKLKNPSKIIVLDLDEGRLELSKELGADVCLNPSEENVVEIIKEMTDGYGADTYIEAVGVPQSVRQGLDLLRNLGTFVEFGLFMEETSANWSTIGDGKELDIKGVHLSAGTYPIAIELLEKKLIDADKIVSETYDLSDFNEAFKAAASLDTIKVLLKP